LVSWSCRDIYYYCGKERMNILSIIYIFLWGYLPITLNYIQTMVLDSRIPRINHILYGGSWWTWLSILKSTFKIKLFQFNLVLDYKHWRKTYGLHSLIFHINEFWIMKVHMMSILHIFRLKLIIISQIANLFMGYSLSLVHCMPQHHTISISLLLFFH
jgi:hypothetical protein